MSKYQLSVLMPSRNEMFTARTIQQVLDNSSEVTEVICVLDGQWPPLPIPQHERVTIVYLPKSVGQRAATNIAASLSKAKYVMKLDSHCALSPGFDRILIDDFIKDSVMLPKMYNLHAFDWLCEKGHRRYQGPSGPCKECGLPTTMDILWKAKPSPETTAMRFDRDLKFQYWGDYKKQQKGDIVETMSILGACWMVERDNYWKWNLSDEGHGSWGQQGTEVACKGWTGGSGVYVNKKCWFAHMFRTQGGDFGFPYPISGSDVDKARKYSKDLWMNNKWKEAKRPFQFIIDKFNPPDWGQGSKGILYYTDGELDPKLTLKVQEQILKAELPVTSVSLKPITFGKSIHLPLKRGPLAMAEQILTGLEAMDCDVVFFAEHDVWYHQDHFKFFPPKKDVVYYNKNVWHLRMEDGFAVSYEAKRLSQLCGYRDILIKHYKRKVEILRENGYSTKIGHEPGTHNRAERVDDLKSEYWESPKVNIDIKHNQNYTKARWSPEEFRNKRSCENWQQDFEIPGYGDTKKFIEKIKR